jgi:hypothetical protein
MLFLREIKVFEARQPLEALVIPKRQGLTRHQGLLASLLHITEMAFLQHLKTSIFRLFGYKRLHIVFLTEGSIVSAILRKLGKCVELCDKRHCCSWTYQRRAVKTIVDYSNNNKI